MPSFIELLREGMRKHTTKTALEYEGETITFREVDLRARSVAATLQEMGLAEGDRAVLFTCEKLPFLICHLGVIMAGGASLPLNPDFTRPEMEYFLRDSGARFVFATGPEAKVIQDLLGVCSEVKAVIDPLRVIRTDKARDFHPPEITPEDPALFLYSSGTTGEPKGAVHTHANLAASLLALKKCWRFTPEDVLLHSLPLFHIHGLSFAAHLALMTGATMIMEKHFHPLKTLEKMDQASVFMGVPPMYYAFLRRPQFKAAVRNLQGMRLFTCGSAPIRPEVLPEIEAILGQPLINRYGMTESHVITSLPLDGPHKMGSVGLPLEGLEMKLVADDGRICGAGETGADGSPKVGEVMIRGENLFKDYWGKPQVRDKSFDSEGFFATGDLGYLDEDDFLTLVGRKKDLVITDGLNVYPAVVERVINGFAQVRESAVIGREDERRGERVVAVVVPEGALNIEALRAHCRERLASYQIPKEFHTVEELPRNTMGKVLKRELKKSFAEVRRPTAAV